MYRNRHIRLNRMAPILDLQSLGAELRIYGEIDEPLMRHFNPSIAWHQGKLKIAIRSCNFAVDRHGKWYLRDGSAYSKTDVLYGNLNPETLEVSNLKKLNLSDDSPVRTKVSGLEDIRLFSRQDGLYALGFESDRLTRSLHNESTSLAEYIIKDNELKYIRTLKKPDRKLVEKNWCPPDEPSNNFDFTYSPTQIYKEGKLIGRPYKGVIHGGSQLLTQKDGNYLSLVHDKVIDPLLNRPRIYDKYVYRHYLAKHNKNGMTIQLSKPFNFGTHENIEFASGMVEHDSYLIISFGIRDCKYGIAKVKKEALTDLLESKEF